SLLLRYGITQRSSPYLPALNPATSKKVVSKTICAFVLTVPLNKKAKFIVMPMRAAKLVKIPKISATPTKTSPQATKVLKSPAFGKATYSRNTAHQPCTAGSSPAALAMAPCRYPLASNPLIFPIPAVNQAYPIYIRINAKIAAMTLLLRIKSNITNLISFKLYFVYAFIIAVLRDWGKIYVQ